jgi:AcrR family transcriptional regulator
VNEQRRRKRSDGLRSREAILREAARLATVEGLDGLSISRLAEAVGMSKSGLFAHFGSKEELQLATIDSARALFDELVVTPAAAAPTGRSRAGASSRHSSRRSTRTPVPCATKRSGS